MAALVNLNYSIRPLGDEACTLVFGDSIDKATNEAVLLVFRHLQSMPQEFIIDLVPAYASLTVFYDPVAVLQQPVTAQTSYEIMCDYLTEQLNNIASAIPGIPTRTIKVPVCYSGEYAPDLSHM